ncbi:SDR family oxidoreductase [Mycobacterium frederiksbergense]|uniref:SDR family oxidoreductase n=1 Tax=Mycolicibacterium frederiksbergense TaxID=117567 RepID=A0A6H0RZJ1_9MYCO|nr:SDR family oxidoreductase [Mycolicibacterium frederiksbergense]MCV7046908.1 SDR family oxidoreductase [Mycolicibacterium frederiksbergense]QIV80528.1 SDR family oxidoreductase [Mycolicibacterium frederiksbergense]
MNKVVVITGAGSGIGRATARVLLDTGHQVVLAGRRPDQLAETAHSHPNALVVPTDVTDSASVRALFERTVSSFGRVDVLFNNAGTFGPAASIADIDDEQWHIVWRTNVDGAVFCAREATRIMTSQLPRGGRIINNGSLAAHRPRPDSLAYAVTKHAISGLTASMLLDLRDLDIDVTQIDIGNAATDMTSGFTAEPTIDVTHVATTIAHIVGLPVDVSVPTITVMARGMRYVGRG